MRVVFEFLGGPRDGERLAGRADDVGRTEAANYFAHTGGARIGATFWCASEYAVNALRSTPLTEIERLEAAGYRFRGHLYEVFLRWQQRRGVLVRARHVGASE